MTAVRRVKDLSIEEILEELKELESIVAKPFVQLVWQELPEWAIERIKIQNRYRALKKELQRRIGALV